MSFFTKLPRERYSAAAFDAFDNRPDFALGTAKSQAWMCQLAYETDEPEKIKDILRSWGLSLTGVVVKDTGTVLPKASTHCLIATGRGLTFLAFAGTDPPVLANWVSDFDVHIEGDGTARGYKIAAEVVWPELQPILLTARANSNIIITGHSLGGSLAALIAHRVQTELGGGVQAVYTFGMPRPGTAQFAAEYNSLLGSRTFRLVHGEDVVPTVAPSFLGFRHVGRFLRCERGAKFDAATLAPNTGSDDPQFEEGVSKELVGLLHGPLSAVLGPLHRMKLAIALLLGIGPAGMRTDPGGIAIELLPPRVRDHMPDRYIGAFN